MNKFIDFFNFKFLKEVDRYLLLNHPFFWNFKLHYISFYSIIATFILIFIDLTPSQINKVSLYLIWLIALIYVYWLYTQKNYIGIREYNKLKLNGSIEYFMYVFSTIIFFLPILTTVIIFFSTLDNYYNATELKQYKFTNNKYCNDNDDNFYCISEDKAEPLNSIVMYINSIDRVNETNVVLAQKQIQSIILKFGIVILIIFFIPFQIIFFRYGGFKNYIYMVLFSLIYLILYSILIQNLELYSSIKWVFYFLGLVTMFILLVSYRLIIFFHLLLFTIIISMSYIMDISYFFEILNKDEVSFLSMLIMIVIQFFIFGLITRYLVFLISQPKE